jgi:hypothetical protein
MPAWAKLTPSADEDEPMNENNEPPDAEALLGRIEQNRHEYEAGVAPLLQQMREWSEQRVSAATEGDDVVAVWRR